MNRAWIFQCLPHKTETKKSMIMSKASSISRLFRTVFRRTFTSKALTPKSPSLFSRLKKNSLEISKWALLAYCTVHFGVEARYCSGPSMEPTIHDGDVILIEKLSSRLHFFQRGDIVVCVNPMDPESVQCKRIVGKYWEDCAHLHNKNAKTNYIS